MYFPSKKDFFLSLIIWLSLIIPLAVFIVESVWPGVPVLTAVAAFWAWLWLATGYTVTDMDLLIKSGPFSWRIPLGSIRRVSSTNNPLSSPALSLDRLEIQYSNHQYILVSPADKESFLKALKQSCPGADIR